MNSVHVLIELCHDLDREHENKKNRCARHILSNAVYLLIFNQRDEHALYTVIINGGGISSAWIDML